VTCRDDDRFATFDIVLRRRGRSRWKWSVRTTDGQAVMCGSECSRGGARYKAERALFLLLCASASRFPRLAMEPPNLVRQAARQRKSAHQRFIGRLIAPGGRTVTTIALAATLPVCQSATDATPKEA
jgi:hypothetical protein